MVQRCTNPKRKSYKDYGARGITVCERWRNSPAAFIEDMGRRPSSAHEIDRIDNAKGYEPGNCQWVTKDVNSKNKRNCRYIELNGERLTSAEWARKLGVSKALICKRLKESSDPSYVLRPKQA